MAFVDGQTKRQALEEEEQVDLTAFHHVSSFRTHLCADPEPPTRCG